MNDQNMTPVSVPKKTLAEHTKEIVWLILLVVVIRSFGYESFRIPSSSMVPTMLVGDFLFVAKWRYGFSRYSLPFSPDLPKGRLFEHLPKQGDVIVFKSKHDSSVQFIKRCIGLPGDRVQVVDGQVFINGKASPLRRIENYDYHDEMGHNEVVPQFIETLPDGVEHPILKAIPFGQGRADHTPEYTVPEGHVFAMGDNRDHSADSRFMSDMGFIPVETLLGPAQLIYFSTERPFFPTIFGDSLTPEHEKVKWYDLPRWFSKEYIWWQPWEWFSSIRWSRFFKIIR